MKIFVCDDYEVIMELARRGLKKDKPHTCAYFPPCEVDKNVLKKKLPSKPCHKSKKELGKS